jgi:hypothetical protein
MKKVNKKQTEDKPIEAGVLEWIFGIITTICALPIILSYFTLNLLVAMPIKYIKRKFWK